MATKNYKRPNAPKLIIYRTTFNDHWAKRLNFVLDKTGLKKSELLREGAKKEIESHEKRILKL